MINTQKLEQFWQAYLATLPKQHKHRHYTLPNAWSFGNSPKMADELGELVIKGIKTATCSRYLGENVHNNAGLSIIVNSQGNVLCLVETYEVTIRCYENVDADFAKAEGEGNLSLDYWRQVHWNFFLNEAKIEGYDVSKDMLLSCERFRVVYRNEDM